MKQFHVETKNQKTGEWSLAHRIKCRYRLGYVTKAWYWPLDCREYTKLVIVDQEKSEMLAQGRAYQLGIFLGRRRRVAGTSVFATVETRITRIDFRPDANVLRTVIWESQEFGKKVGTNGEDQA